MRAIPCFEFLELDLAIEEQEKQTQSFSLLVVCSFQFITVGWQFCEQECERKRVSKKSKRGGKSKRGSKSERGNKSERGSRSKEEREQERDRKRAGEREGRGSTNHCGFGKASTLRADECEIPHCAKVQYVYDPLLP